MFEPIEVLTTESLEVLRTSLLTDQDPRFLHLDELKQMYPITTYKRSIELDRSLHLVMTSEEPSSRESDRRNSLALSGALKGVRWQHLREETLWVSLCFGPFFDYACDRWGITSDADKVKTILRNHWFTSGSRSLWRDHAISRLWWVGTYVNEFQEMNADDLSRLLYFDSDMLGNLFGRPSLLSSKPLATGLFTILHRHHFSGAQSVPYDREKFRKFMRNLDLRCGAVLVDALSKEETDLMLNSEFERAFK